MKILFLFLLLCPSAFAGDVVLTWTLNPPAEGVLRYRLHYGTAPRTYTQAVDNIPPNTLFQTITGLSTGTWYFALTACNNAVPVPCSNFSAEVSKVITVGPGDSVEAPPILTVK